MAVEFTVAGDVASFEVGSFGVRWAALLDVELIQLQVSVSAASIAIVTTVGTAAAADAKAVASTIIALTSNLDHLSSALNVTLLRVGEVAMLLASPPPAHPPPPVALHTSGSSLTVVLAVAGGGALLLLVLGSLGWVVRRRQRVAAEVTAQRNAAGDDSKSSSTLAGCAKSTGRRLVDVQPSSPVGAGAQWEAKGLKARVPAPVDQSWHPQPSTTHLSSHD